MTTADGPDRRFPTTTWSIIAYARDTGTARCRSSLSRLANLYYRPIYWTLRLNWNRGEEEARELTQEFFARLLEKGGLGQFEPERGRFRTYLRAALGNFVRRHLRDARRLKRGGGVNLVAVEEWEAPPVTLAAEGASAEELFDELWRTALLRDALEAARRQCEAAGKRDAFTVYARYDLAEEETTYAALAGELGMSEHQVRAHLRNVRALVRAIVRERILETMTDTADVDDEYRTLFARS
jgi:RNA polymerase sigma-70 factor (ECF subfamily)